MIRFFRRFMNRRELSDLSQSLAELHARRAVAVEKHQARSNIDVRIQDIQTRRLQLELGRR